MLDIINKDPDLNSMLIFNVELELHNFSITDKGLIYRGATFEDDSKILYIISQFLGDSITVSRSSGDTHVIEPIKTDLRICFHHTPWDLFYSKLDIIEGLEALGVPFETPTLNNSHNALFELLNSLGLEFELDTSGSILAIRIESDYRLLTNPNFRELVETLPINTKILLTPSDKNIELLIHDLCGKYSLNPREVVINSELGISYIESAKEQQYSDFRLRKELFLKDLILYSGGKYLNKLNHQASNAKYEEVILISIFNDITHLINESFPNSEVKLIDGEVLVTIPKIDKSNYILKKLKDRLSLYGININLSFFDDNTSSHWDHSKILKLFDFFLKELVCLKLECKSDSINIEVYSTLSEIDLEKISSELSSLFKKQVIIKCIKVDTDLDLSGLSPSLVREYLKATDVSVSITDANSPREHRICFPQASVPVIEPIGKVFSIDNSPNGITLIDSAQAVLRVEGGIRVQIFLANPAAYLLPGFHELEKGIRFGRRIFREYRKSPNILSDSFLRMCSLIRDESKQAVVIDFVVPDNGTEFRDICIGVTKVKVGRNFNSVNKIIPKEFSNEIDLYIEMCNRLREIRKEKGALLVSDPSEFIFEEPTLVVNYLASLFAIQQNIPVIYLETFDKRKIGGLESKRQVLNNIFEGFNIDPQNLNIPTPPLKSQRSLDEDIDLIIEELLKANQLDAAIEVKVALIGTLRHTAKPSNGVLKMGHSSLVRIAPGLRDACALLNLVQILGHLLNRPVYSKAQLGIFAEILNKATRVITKLKYLN